jgi:hypothetical protein
VLIRLAHPPPLAWSLQGDYRIIGSTEIQAEMTKLTGEVASVLDIPPECARTLLIHFRSATHTTTTRAPISLLSSPLLSHHFAWARVGRMAAES